jgi:hypothetical protein
MAMGLCWLCVLFDDKFSVSKGCIGDKYLINKNKQIIKINMTKTRKN